MMNLCWGMHHLNITQLPNNNYSHKNLLAVDLAGEDGGIDFWKAMGYWKCTGRWANSGTHFFVPCDEDGDITKVHCADGVNRIVTIAMTHSTKNYDIGRVYHDVEMYREGTKGQATGNHIHLEISEGIQNTKTYSNGQYRMKNALNPLDVFFVLNSYTKVVKTLGAKVNYCDSLEYKEEVTNMKDGLNEITYSGVKFKVSKCDKDHEMVLLQSSSKSSIGNIIADGGEVPMTRLNCSYFAMINGKIQVQGVNQGDMFDDAPKSDKYLVLAQLNDGGIVSGLSNEYWYAKKDVKFAFTPYSITKDGSTTLSTAFANKEAQSNTQSFVFHDGESWYLGCTAQGYKCTPYIARSMAQAYGAKIVALLDSGGSTQMMFNREVIVKSSDNRSIPNVLSFVKKKNVVVEPPKEPTIDVSELETLKKENAILSDKLKKIKEVLEG